MLDALDMALAARKPDNVVHHSAPLGWPALDGSPGSNLTVRAQVARQPFCPPKLSRTHIPARISSSTLLSDETKAIAGAVRHAGEPGTGQFLSKTFKVDAESCCGLLLRCSLVLWGSEWRRSALSVSLHVYKDADHR